ncbi:class I SAM-dependent methyltransferase [Gammaproteobacteria bacterium]|nr:class I SAM-dependent methyltransferase [Gammaproteobacteria bacterium]MDB9841940.1 class I SAM-dependent methyltransferase [Gammaproteobacteria bacterium]
MTKIIDTLKKLNLISDSRRELYSKSTRDIENLNVFKDSATGIIYIDDFYCGDEMYISGQYRETDKEISTEKIDPQVEIDAARRFKDFQSMCIGKSVLDFGCGEGAFLAKIKNIASDFRGIELQENFIEKLLLADIPVFNSLDEVEDSSIDVIFLFHVLEHLPDPIPIINSLQKKLKSDGKIVFEVPNANDFLLSYLESDEFKNFTIWSQHLILHTHESLKKLLEFAGLSNIKVEGVQRFPISNHLYWAKEGLPGGQHTKIASLDSPSLHKAYEDELNTIYATDTLIAYGSK